MVRCDKFLKGRRNVINKMVQAKKMGFRMTIELFTIERASLT
jgi:hypothetical protein